MDLPVNGDNAATSHSPTLELAVVTLGEEGILRVERMIPPPSEGVGYVISWQCYHGIDLPSGLRRDDVRVCRVEGKGISSNRNHALDNCRADIILFADDDLAYNPGSFDAIRKAFSDNPDMEIALFKAKFPVAKTYPGKSGRIALPFPKGYYVTSFEIAARRERIADLRCHPSLGIGAPSMTCGEDEFFIISAIKRGMDIRFINHEICAHPAMSTGLRRPTPGDLRAQGCIISIQYPGSFPLRLLLKAWRLSRAGKSPLLKSLRHLASGALKRRHLLRAPRLYRW